jgi:hypothetical protein
MPPKQKVTPRARPEMALAILFIDAILKNVLNAPFNQRHTAHRIWGRMQIEMPACEVSESTVRAHVRARKAELDVGGGNRASFAKQIIAKILCIVGCGE